MAGQIVNRGPKKWMVRIYLGRDGDGKRRYHNKTIHGTKKDAERYRTKVLRDRDTGELVEPSRKPLGESALDSARAIRGSETTVAGLRLRRFHMTAWSRADRSTVWASWTVLADNPLSSIPV